MSGSKSSLRSPRKKEAVRKTSRRLDFGTESVPQMNLANGMNGFSCNSQEGGSLLNDGKKDESGYRKTSVTDGSFIFNNPDLSPEPKSPPRFLPPTNLPPQDPESVVFGPSPRKEDSKTPLSSPVDNSPAAVNGGVDTPQSASPSTPSFTPEKVVVSPGNGTEQPRPRFEGFVARTKIVKAPRTIASQRTPSKSPNEKPANGGGVSSQLPNPGVNFPSFPNVSFLNSSSFSSNSSSENMTPTKRSKRKKDQAFATSFEQADAFLDESYSEKTIPFSPTDPPLTFPLSPLLLKTNPPSFGAIPNAANLILPSGIALPSREGGKDSSPLKNTGKTKLSSAVPEAKPPKLKEEVNVEGTKKHTMPSPLTMDPKKMNSKVPQPPVTNQTKTKHNLSKKKLVTN